MKVHKNQKGQSLIEYLIIVALVAVSALGMVKAVGTNITIHFANIAKALAGKEETAITPVQVKFDKKKNTDLSNYMESAKRDH